MGKENNFKSWRVEKNLKDEIDFLKKIVFNFSQYIINYNYISNFYYLDNYIHRKNENLEKFRNSFNFQDENKYINIYWTFLRIIIK